jgi:ribose/xylose/arabinose/galactoside ABC-type transport system permease subunit
MMSQSANTSAPSQNSTKASDIIRNYGIHLVLLVLIVITALISPQFLAGRNISNMLLQAAPLGIVVIGQVLVILVRGLDLSVASVMATAAVVATSFNGQDSDALIVFAVAIAIGLATGLVNGLLITKRSVSPFLATLATLTLLQGIRFAYTQGAPSGNVPPIYRVLGSQLYYGIPFNMIILAALTIVFSLLLHKSTFGRRIYITGGNPITARLVGINADRVTIACYVISGALAALAGLILSGFVGIVDNWVGRGFELDSIVAAVMGGVALSGGRGSIIGGLLGTAILVVVFNAVLMIGFPVQLQFIIKGLVIIIAAAFYVRRTH